MDKETAALQSPFHSIFPRLHTSSAKRVLTVRVRLSTLSFLDNDRLFIFSAIAYSKEKGGQRCAKLGMVVNSVHS
jgi:hypothetical protein